MRSSRAVRGLAWCLAAWFAPIGAARGDVAVATVLGDHMVIQQGMPVPIWGSAEAGEQVTVTLGDQKQTATADAQGSWRVQLDALKAGDQPVEIKIAGKNELTLKDVLVGEVWVCSGQSNMEFALSRANDQEAEIKAADHPQIRLFTVPHRIAEQPVHDTQGAWVACSPESVPKFSAVGYFFGRDLQRVIKVPIGLVHASWGGTPIEAWTSLPVLKAEPAAQSALEVWQHADEDYAKAREQWKQDAAKAKAAGQKAPRAPVAPSRNASRPGGLYNGMIVPIMPLAMRGVIWYQGEANVGRAYQYRKLLPDMIKCWRDAWGREFSFLIVSLPNFRDIEEQPGESDRAELREAQAMAAAQPHNGLAITIDVGEAKNNHPTDKQTVGHRLMLQALRVAYGQDIVASGPVFAAMNVEGEQVRVRFRNAEGLTARGSSELKGFAVAGADRKFHWAKAVIEGDCVVLHCDQVVQPQAVRYAWAINPVCNLYNAAGLPAAPFRTDDWPGITASKK